MIAPKLRKATLADSAQLLAWHNDPHSLAMSKTKQPVNDWCHEQWLRTVLDDPGCHLFILEDDMRTEAWQKVKIRPVGTGRLQIIRAGTVELSYSVGSTYRGGGYGAKLVGLLCEQAVKLGYQEILAEVHTANTASLCVLLRHGFMLPDSQFLRAVKSLTEA